MTRGIGRFEHRLGHATSTAWKWWRHGVGGVLDQDAVDIITAKQQQKRQCSLCSSCSDDGVRKPKQYSEYG